MSEYKEFWNVIFEDGTSEIYAYERAATSQKNAKIINHVIEYEAFENLCREMVQVKHLANTWFDENKKLKEQNEIMREALSFYASGNNWHHKHKDSCDYVVIVDDQGDGEFQFNSITDDEWVGGKRARQALKELETV